MTYYSVIVQFNHAVILNIRWATLAICLAGIKETLEGLDVQRHDTVAIDLKPEGMSG